jgi:hypothetical protein
MSAWLAIIASKVCRLNLEHWRRGGEMGVGGGGLAGARDRMLIIERGGGGK